MKQREHNIAIHIYDPKIGTNWKPDEQSIVNKIDYLNKRYIAGVDIANGIDSTVIYDREKNKIIYVESYQDLQEGDKIEKGDECKDKNGDWREVPESYIGCVVNSQNRYRRKIQKPISEIVGNSFTSNSTEKPIYVGKQEIINKYLGKKIKCVKECPMDRFFSEKWEVGEEFVVEKVDIKINGIFLYPNKNETQNINADRVVIIEEKCTCFHSPKQKKVLEGACDLCKNEFYKWLETQENAFDRIADTLPDLTLDLSKLEVRVITKLGGEFLINYLKGYFDCGGDIVNTFTSNAKKKGLKVMIINLDQPKKSHPKSEYVSKKVSNKVKFTRYTDYFTVEILEGEDKITPHLNEFAAPTWETENKFRMSIKFFELIKSIAGLENVQFTVN